ncbi:MAG TPA: Calx-beta domain-containing protein, partial [Candidatus Paceibacterota bacterium]|nr:Calx-beta domain-containing protein [Candidatus Paceibacterota bacterium]
AASGATSSYVYGSVLYVENDIPALNPGAVAQFTVQAQPFKTVSEPIIFAADSQQPDPTPSDNSLYNYYEQTNWLHITVTNGPGVLSFAGTSFSAAENSGGATINVIRQGGSAGTVSVNYATTGGSAKSGVNYTPASGTLTFAPGQTAASFTVPLLDDGVLSPDVSVNLGLSGVTGGFLGVPTNATLTINESDFPTNPVGNLQLVSAAITNSPLIFGNQPASYDTPYVTAITPDGRYVLFNSYANNLTIGVANADENVFVRDMNTNFVTLVNVTPAGNVGNAAASGYAITPDGRYMVFESQATDLTPGNASGNNQIFVRDLVLGQTKLVSLGTNGFAGGSGYSYGAKISDSGRYVFFTSYALDLVPQPTVGSGDVFMRDTWSNVTTLVSINTNGTAGSDNNGSDLDGITPDGRFAVFEGSSSNLSPVPATNSVENVFVRDTVAGTTTLVSVNSAGTQSGSSYSSSPAITPDGTFVAFASNATNLTEDVITNGHRNIFLRNLVAGSTVLVSLGTNGLAGTRGSGSPTVSSNGQFVAFGSYADNLSPLAAGITSEEVFVRDVVNGTNRLVSIDFAGTNSADSYSQNPQMTPDGRFVVFDSGATDLTTNQGIGYDNIFVADLVSNTMTLASLNINGSPSTGASGERITPDGRYVAFKSSDYTLALGAPYNTGEIYRRDLGGSGAPAATAPVSATFSRTANNSSPATAFSMSANGRWIAFDSYALNLVQNQTNGNGNIFLADTLSNTLTLLNLNTNGGLPDYYSASGPQISADGNVVAFISQASDLVTNPVNNLYNYNVFAYNLTNGGLSLVSVNRSGGSDNGSSSLVGLSPDGRYILFSSYSTNLTAVNLANNFWQHLYVRDLLAGTTVMVDVTATNGLPGDSNAGTGSITPDGRFVAFTSASDWLVPGVSNVTGSFQDYQIYVRDLVAGSNTLVSATPSGGPTTNEFGVYYAQPLISTDDRYVVFGSSSLDLLAGNTNTFGQVYQRDLLTGQTHLISVNLAGTSGGNGYADSSPGMTPDGRYVVFGSYASDLTPSADTNNTDDVFVRDTVANTTTLVSINGSGTGTANAASQAPVISSDGRYVTFQSFATDLVPGAFAAGVGNIYRRDLVNGVTLLISGNLAGSGGGSGRSENPAMNADGSVVAFDSAAYDLTPQDLNQDNDLFVFGFVSVSNTADLALGVSAPPTASVGNNFSLTLTVTNLGPTNATGVAVVDTLPPGVSFVSANASQGTPVFGGGQVTCALGGLASGASATVTITVKPTVAGLIYNDASVSGNQPDPNPYNNTAQTAVTVSGSSAPVLTIGRLTGNQFQISWPTSSNLELQTATNLEPPIAWQPVTNGIVDNGGVSSMVVTNVPGGGNHFYRLATP